MTQASGDFPAEASPADAYAALRDDADAQLVDVRTRQEWQAVGVPDLAPAGKAPILLEWQVAPDMHVDPAFVERLTAALAERGLGRDTPLYFLCRSGARSAAAAGAAAAAGFTHTVNVVEGFEGLARGPDHREGGWKQRALPWSGGSGH
jgi:rhodanese-related sulfurtransferase